MQDNRIALEHGYWWLLCFVLSVATGIRFYLLDSNSFNGQDLFNISFCSVDGWFARSGEFFARTGLPSVYPTILCLFVDPASKVDIFVRVFSASVGVGVVWSVYLVGARFFSHLTGLLAAILVSVDFHSIVLSRSITPYGFFAFMYLLHLYALGGIFIDKKEKSPSLGVNIDKENFSLNFRWETGIRLDSLGLLGFWLSAFFVFYANPMFTVAFIVEALTVFLFLDKVVRVRTLLWCFAPICLMAMPWFLMKNDAIGWAIRNNQLEWIPLDWSRLSQLPFGKINPSVVLVIFLTSIGALLIGSRSGKKREIAFLSVCVINLFVAIFVVHFIKAVDPKSFVYSTLLVSVLVANMPSIFLNFIKVVWLKNTILVVLCVTILLVSMGRNSKDGLYVFGADRGIEWAVKIVASDDGFMRGNRGVVVSHPVFDYYLAQYGVTKKSTVPMSALNADSAFLNPSRTDFYYLEYDEKRDGFKEDALDLLGNDGKFTVVCISHKKRFRVVKFSSGQSQASPAGHPVSCRESSVNAGGAL